MPVESWTNPEDAPELAAHATAVIDAALVGTGLAREAYWAAVRKGYNTPYNDPPRRPAMPARPVATSLLGVEPEPETPLLPVAAMAAIAAEARVG